MQQAVICPGSRSAPLTLAFVRNKKINCRTFSDERSAAFIALGMAQQTGYPVALVCTSGSAAYNFAPAIAEAFFQQIPLVVFTADRPKEWIDQLDGQTIQQAELYGKHVKKYFELPQDYEHPDAVWHAARIINEAINLAQSGQQGPVHINAPFREPLYPAQDDSNSLLENVKNIEAVLKRTDLFEGDWTKINKAIESHKRILVVAGQGNTDPTLYESLSQCYSKFHWPIVGDVLSNLHSLPFYCSHTDTFLGSINPSEKEELKPDLLITFGKSIVSKNLKLFLRKYKPSEHWHLQPEGIAPDTFQSLTRVLPIHPSLFFEKITAAKLTPNSDSKTYGEVWLEQEKASKEAIGNFFSNQLTGEFTIVHDIIRALPDRCTLHLANSMTVRYANHIGLLPSQKNVTVFCNRGTSGIDGCTSTAVGHSLMSDVPNILITGDLAFFYDRNAFWHNYPLPNLIVVVLNNHGGIIFNLIDGPAGLPEADEFFITRQSLTAKSLATEFGFEYVSVEQGSVPPALKSTGKTKIIEYDSTQSLNKEIFQKFKEQIKQVYETKLSVGTR